MNTKYDYHYKPQLEFHSGANSLASSISSASQYQSYVFDTPKTLQVDSPYFSRGRTIFLDGQTLFTITHKAFSLSGLTTIVDSKGHPICNYTNKHHCFGPNVYTARDGGNKSIVWEMNLKHSGASAKVNTVSIQGGFGGTSVDKLQYLQKNRMQLQGELVHPAYGTVARVIRQTKWTMKKYSIEIMPGMDLLLVVSIIAAVQDKVATEQSNSSASAASASAASASSAAAAAASVS